MVDVHRLNPNAMLVLLGTVIYVAVGGPFMVAGGVVIALGLGALHRPGRRDSGDDGPMSLFGSPTGDLPPRPRQGGPTLCLVPAFAPLGVGGLANVRAVV